MRVILLCVLIAPSLLVGCSEYGLEGNTRLGPQARPNIEVYPEVVNFGSVSITNIGEWPTREVEIRNIGEGLLEVDNLAVVEGPFFVVDPPERLEIEAGESAFVSVEYIFDQPGLSEGALQVESNDSDESSLRVPISGRARGPWLYVDPPRHDFGSSPIGCDDEVDVVVQNLGDEALTVESWTWEADPALTARFEREPPFELQPGGFVLGSVALSAFEPGDFAGELVVNSTDPRGPQQSDHVASPVRNKTRTEPFPLPGEPPVDLIVAVDRSASMEDDADLLGRSFVSFASAIGEVTSNWRMGVVTLDNGCFNGGMITADRDNYLGVFRWAVLQGNDREIQDDEALFSIVDRAIANTAEGRCNAGFRRPEAALHVIVVSDEPERSTERSVELTWDTFVSRWEGLVTTPSLLKVSGVLDLDGCGDGADGYVQAIEATNGEALSLCGADWTEAATTLASATLERVISVKLAKTPVPGSFVVRIDGTIIDADRYTYDASTNSVIMRAPPPGSKEVSVHYTVLEEC